MADDINKDLDPEEDNNEPFEDDDFGLPDLEYDELEDDEEFEDEFGDPSFEDESTDEEPSEELTESEEEALSIDSEFEEDIFEEEVSEEEIGEEDFLEEEMEDFGEDDTNTFDISEEELQKELEELESSDTDFEFDESEGDDAGFYEQETYDDFSDENVLDSVFGADDSSDDSNDIFSDTSDNKPTQPVKGPSIDSTAKQRAASQYASSYNSGSEKSGFAKIVVIGAIAILVVAVALWQFDSIFGSEKKEVVKKEQPKPTPTPVAEEPKKEEPKKEEVKPKKPVATPTTPGVVQSLEQRTGKAYVIIASFVDGDLALDHANKLAGTGKSPYVIPPFNNGLYYRVAIAEFNNFADATQNLGSYKEEFGTDIWTLRY